MPNDGVPIFNIIDGKSVFKNDPNFPIWRPVPEFPADFKFIKPSIPQVDGALVEVRKQVYKGHKPPFSRKQLRKILLIGGYVSANGPAMVVEIPRVKGERELPTFIRLNWKALSEGDKRFMRAVLRTTIKQLEKVYQIYDAKDKPIPSLLIWLQKVIEYNLPF